MKKLVLLSWLLVTFINSDLISQSRAEIKNDFYEAESLVLFEAYKDALPLYQSLLKIYPTNSNYKYRIGQCYLSIPGEKIKAISYLEDAVKNINLNYKEGKFIEKGAPYDALFYLADAYRINYQLDKAIETYETFRKNINTEKYDTAILNLQIRSCLTAKKLMLKPVYLKKKNIGNIINGISSEYNPVVSDKEDMLIFSRSLPFYEAILYSTKTSSQWSNPVNMNELLKVDRDLFPTSISKDGKEIYFYSSADFDGNIYTSGFEKGNWSPLVKLNDNINTKFWESHATISHDNSKLYFTSNRKGTLGGLDIYVSRRESSGDWGPAVNLGPVINTPYNEETPFLSEDDKTLFFSSRGHSSMGGYDIFSSKLLENGGWSVPLNTGYPLNTTDDDVFYKTLKDGYEAYISKDDTGGFGNQDIYHVELFSESHPRNFFVKGIAKVADLISNFNESVKITVTNLKSPKQELIIHSNPATGGYDFRLHQGNYQITYEGEGAEKTVKNLDILVTNPSDTIIFPMVILPRTDFVADLKVKGNKTITVVNGDTITIPLSVEPKSLLNVEHRVGDLLISGKQYVINDSTFNYKMIPVHGVNKVTFNLTDRFNNTSSDDVFITWEKGFIQQRLTRPEKINFLAEKQIAAYIALLKKYANDKILKLLSDPGIKKQQFMNIDDLLTYLKKEGVKTGINPEELDMLALRVAVNHNVLTQAAVDLMAKYTYGELKQILGALDIYQSNLKSWTDLQQYVSAKTNGRISPEELNRIAAAILAGIDPAILIIREKILAFGQSSGFGTIIRQSVAKVDLRNIRLKEKWLLAFCNESVKEGLTIDQISEMLAAISSSPGTPAEQFQRDLIGQSEEPLISSLKSINLIQEKIASPKDLIRFLLMNKDKVKYPEEAVYKGIANLIVTKAIKEEKEISNNKDQVDEFIRILKSLADDRLLKIIADADIMNKQFANVDDLLTYLKKEAARQGMSPEELDMLALRIALMNNILSQAAVDLMAKYTYGELKQILGALNIYQANLKTWTDLQQYVSAKTNGRISPEDLNKIAAAILAGIDPAILIIRDKILAFAENSRLGPIIRQSVATVDLNIIKIKEKWLMAFSRESVKEGLTNDQLAEMLAMISSLPGTKAEQYLRDLIEQSEEPLLTSLKSINLKKEKIKSPKDLIMFLLMNKDKVTYPEEAVYKSIANLIVSKDIPENIIASQLTTGKKHYLWILYIVLGAGLFFLLFFILRKRRKENVK